MCSISKLEVPRMIADVIHNNNVIWLQLTQCFRKLFFKMNGIHGFVIVTSLFTDKDPLTIVQKPFSLPI